MKSFNQNKICHLLNIKYPIIQAGMVWVSGAKLAAAAANAGCLGVIGAGSMNPTLLDEHIKKAKRLSLKAALGVNLPLLYTKVEEQIEICLKNKINIFITSAGTPKKYTSLLKKENAIVIHVVSSPLLAQKCVDAGVDAIIAEGFEAGGHNGRDEITTMALIPQVRDQINVPIIAAGGIYDGRQMAAAFCLGADAVQIGTGFVTTHESSAHDHFKEAILNSVHGDTKLMMKKYIPVRLLKNEFSKEIQKLEDLGASKEELMAKLGKGLAKKGMLEGEVQNGELEIGQVSSMISSKLTVQQYIDNLLQSYQKTITQFL